MADTYWAEREGARWDVYGKQRGWMAQADTEDDARLIVAGLAALQAPPAAAVPEDAIEAAYWDFDARHKGYGRHKTTPQSERDAFKWAVRAMLAAERKGE